MAKTSATDGRVQTTLKPPKAEAKKAELAAKNEAAAQKKQAAWGSEPYEQAMGSWKRAEGAVDLPKSDRIDMTKKVVPNPDMPEDPKDPALMRDKFFDQTASAAGKKLNGKGGWNVYIEGNQQYDPEYEKQGQRRRNGVTARGVLPSKNHKPIVGEVYNVVRVIQSPGFPKGYDLALTLDTQDKAGPKVRLRQFDAETGKLGDKSYVVGDFDPEKMTPANQKALADAIAAKIAKIG